MTRRVVQRHTTLGMVERVREPALVKERARHQRLGGDGRTGVVAAQLQPFVEQRFGLQVLAP